MAKIDPFDAVPSATRPIVEAARRVVRAVAPRDAEEVACRSQRPRSPSMMWKLVRYTLGGETVVTIGTFTKHSSIFFTRGAELDDGSGALEGEGKVLRYVTLRAPEDAEGSGVKALVRRAFALEARPRRVAKPRRKAAKKR